MKIPILKKYIESESVFIERRLPTEGSIFVKVGDEVNSFDTIGDATVIKESEKVTIKGKVLVKMNQRVYPGDVICSNKKLFKSENTCTSISGRVTEIDEKAGYVFIEGITTNYNLIAGVKGTVVDILDKNSVLIKTPAVLVRAVVGCGEEVAGELKYIDSEVLSEASVDDTFKGKIIVVSRMDSGAVYKARLMGAIGFILASCEYSEYLKYMEDKFNLVVIEGFGKLTFISPFKNYLEKIDSVFAVLRTYESLLVIPREKIVNILGKKLNYRNHFLTEAAVGDMVVIFTKENYGDLGIIKDFSGNNVVCEIVNSKKIIEVSPFSCGLISY